MVQTNVISGLLKIKKFFLNIKILIPLESALTA